MTIIRTPLVLAALIACVAAAPASHAQFAVIDSAAIAHLVQEVQTMQQALETARAQLGQAQQALQSMSGNRGMEALLSGLPRNYLPADWRQLATVLQDAGNGYTALAADVRSLTGTNAILSAQSLAGLSQVDRQRVVAARSLAAMGQVIARDAVANASARFASIQRLIDAIGTARDQKGILDLQARIGAEQGMLLDEQTKLQSLFQAIAAEETAGRQQQREQIVAAQGVFSSRFQPHP